MHHLLEIWVGWVQQWGYIGIIALMAMESSILPVPSEVVIPPAAFLAAQGELNAEGKRRLARIEKMFNAKAAPAAKKEDEDVRS